MQKDIKSHLAQIGSQEVFTVPLTRSTVLQWIDYIEVGHAGSEDDSTCRNQVAVHYIEAANDKKMESKKPWEVLWVVTVLKRHRVL